MGVLEEEGLGEEQPRVVALPVTLGDPGQASLTSGSQQRARWYRSLVVTLNSGAFELRYIPVPGPCRAANYAAMASHLTSLPGTPGCRKGDLRDGLTVFHGEGDWVVFPHCRLPWLQSSETGSIRGGMVSGSTLVLF